MCLHKLGDCKFGDWKVNRFLVLMLLCCVPDEDLFEILGQQQNPCLSTIVTGKFFRIWNQIDKAFVSVAHVGGVVVL